MACEDEKKVMQPNPNQISVYFFLCVECARFRCKQDVKNCLFIGKNLAAFMWYSLSFFLCRSGSCRVV